MVAVAAGLGAMAISQVISFLISEGLRIAKREAGRAVAVNVVFPKYEKLSLSYVIDQIVTDPEERRKIKEALKTEPGLREANAFVEFLRSFNVQLAKDIITMGAIDPFWASAVAQLGNAISWSYGFGWMSWVGLSPLLNAIISTRARIALNEILPSRSLTKSEVIKLFKTGKIDETTFRNLLKEMGYTDKAINAYVQLAKEERTEKERDLTKSEILRAYREGILSEDEVRDKLREMGYDPEEIDILINLYKPQKEIEVRGERRKLSLSTIRKAYYNGLIDKDTALVRLRDLGYSDEDARLLIALWDADKTATTREKDRDLTKSDILKAFELGLIDWDEAKDMLMQIGYDEDEAEFLLAIRALTVMKRASTSESQTST